MSMEELEYEIFLHKHFVDKRQHVLGVWKTWSKEDRQRRRAVEYGEKMGWLNKATITPAKSFAYNGQEDWYYLTPEGEERFFNRQS